MCLYMKIIIQLHVHLYIQRFTLRCERFRVLESGCGDDSVSLLVHCLTGRAFLPVCGHRGREGHNMLDIDILMKHEGNVF